VRYGYGTVEALAKFEPDYWVSDLRELVAPAPLKPLHAEEAHNAVKLVQFDRCATDTLLASLLPGQAGALKARFDGTMLDGHHRIKVLRSRGVDVDALPREIVDRLESSS
jgi:hypothetical protein